MSSASSLLRRPRPKNDDLRARGERRLFGEVTPETHRRVPLRCKPFICRYSQSSRAHRTIVVQKPPACSSLLDVWTSPQFLQRYRRMCVVVGRFSFRSPLSLFSYAGEGAGEPEMAVEMTGPGARRPRMVQGGLHIFTCTVFTLPTIDLLGSHPYLLVRSD